MPILEMPSTCAGSGWREAPARERHALVTAFGALSRQVHDAGVFQDDFAPNNFLVRRGVAPQLFMIDFERARLRTGNDEAARCFMLAKIDRVLAGAPVGDRMRFLYAYALVTAPRSDAGGMVSEEFAEALARRDFARIDAEGHASRVAAFGGWPTAPGGGMRRSEMDDALLLDALPEELPSAAPYTSKPSRSSGGSTTAACAAPREGASGRWRTSSGPGAACPRPLGAWSRDDETILLLERRHRGRGRLDQCPDRTAGRWQQSRILLDRVFRALARNPRAPPSGNPSGRAAGGLCASCRPRSTSYVCMVLEPRPETAVSAYRS